MIRRNKTNGNNATIKILEGERKGWTSSSLSPSLTVVVMAILRSTQEFVNGDENGRRESGRVCVDRFCRQSVVGRLSRSTALGDGADGLYGAYIGVHQWNGRSITALGHCDVDGAVWCSSPYRPCLESDVSNKQERNFIYTNFDVAFSD
mmetsp:Transcript_13633/g.24655  ORF Transcript_13633/g.24655 Transcript_13633/m.24655 type:complete len:149 (-) Transcript_13633:185-631(-)